MNITITITESKNIAFPPLRRAVLALIRSLASKYQERELVTTRDRSTTPYTIGPYSNVIEPDHEYTFQTASMQAVYEGGKYTLTVSTSDAQTFNILISLKDPSFLPSLLRELRESGIAFTAEQTTITITTTIEQLRTRELLNSIW